MQMIYQYFIILIINTIKPFKYNYIKSKMNKILCNIFLMTMKSLEQTD